MHAVTSGLPPGAQADHWRRLISSAFGPMHLMPRDRDGFPARLSARTLGPVQAGQVWAPGHSVLRSPRQIARDTRECVKLGLVLDGWCLLSQNGRQTRVGVGDLVLYDLTRPLEITFEEHRVLTLVIPHQAMPLPLDRVAALGGTLLNERTGRLVNALLRGLAADGAAAEGPYARHLGEALLELVTGAIGERLGGPPAATADPELLRAIEGWVDDRLHDPQLSPAVIAAAHHLSVRQLYRVFQLRGTTVARYVRTRRLERCRRELADPFLATQRIGEIACRWGFPDAAAFSRAFRAAYGLSPRDYRAATSGVDRPY